MHVIYIVVYWIYMFYVFFFFLWKCRISNTICLLANTSGSSAVPCHTRSQHVRWHIQDNVILQQSSPPFSPSSLFFSFSSFLSSSVPHCNLCLLSNFPTKLLPTLLYFTLVTLMQNNGRWIIKIYDNIRTVFNIWWYIWHFI